MFFFQFCCSGMRVHCTVKLYLRYYIRTCSMVHHEVCVDDGFWKWCTLWFSSSRKIFVLTYVYMKRYRHLNICSIGALYVHCYDESYVHHTLICELIKWQCCILSLRLLNINVEGETILLETPLKHPHEDTYDPRWAHYKITKKYKKLPYEAT